MQTVGQDLHFTPEGEACCRSLSQDAALPTFLQWDLRGWRSTAEHSATKTNFSSTILPCTGFTSLFPTFLLWKRQFRKVCAYKVLGGSLSNYVKNPIIIQKYTLILQWVPDRFYLSWLPRLWPILSKENCIRS